ncbi:serine hydrolase [Cohnella panacarvi]|uniref:serine hydrolase n=1 Tax=Cohnella panacarvi TaxID=400776 RepID=UPI00047DC203|nr:serine hydrolase [Cohnella panacarvi]
MAKKRTTAYLLALSIALSTPLWSLALAKPVSAAVETDAREALGFMDEFFSRPEAIAQAGAAAVAVVKDGQVVVARGYGVTNRETKQAVDPTRTTFRVGSVSKVFTAAALMQLVEQGKVSLEDNIEKYLDGYKVDNPFAQPVTVAMLLTHTTGFEVRDPTAANILFDPAQQPVALKEAIVANFPPVAREPGTSYMYDNFAYGLAGYIVQQASGQSFNDYMRQHIFGPLGMDSSSFLQEDRLLAETPTVYDPTGAAVPVYRLSPDVIPEGSMLTTAEDMSKFMLAYLGGGTTADGKRILSPESIQAMSSYHQAIHPDVLDSTYGFEGPFVDANGHNVIMKGGSITGFESLLWMLPDRRTGVFVSYNANSPLSIELFSEFMDRFFPGQSKLGDAGFKEQSAAELAKFEGHYQDLRVGAVNSVRVVGDGTLSAGNSAGIRRELKQVDDSLFVDEDGMPMAFQLDREGRVQYMKYNYANPGSYASKVASAKPFADVPAGHSYAKYINVLHDLGIVEANESGAFGVEETVTRGQFIHALMKQFGIPGSNNAPAFQDIGESPYRAEIQTAAELGLVHGTGRQMFRPDVPIKREEAAVILSRLLVVSGIPPQPSNTVLAPGTSEWAESAVQQVIDLELHGPEVAKQGGLADYHSERVLTKQELAAIQYLLILPEVSLVQ